MEKELFERLIKGMEEMVAIEKGEIEVPPHRIHRHKIPKPKVSRTKISLEKGGDRWNEVL